MLAVGKLTGAHALQQIEIFSDAAITIRAVFSGLGQRAPITSNLIRIKAVDVSSAFLDQLSRGCIQIVEIIRCMRQPVFPVEPKPAHVVDDRIYILLVFLAGIRVIETQERPSAGLRRNAEIQADRHYVADMQIAVGLRRKASNDSPVFFPDSRSS